MRVRLADVARQAGVSEATVSRVLNGKPGVSEAQRKTILTALEVLGYVRPARGRGRNAGLVGLVVPELVNPAFPLLAQTLETELAHHGYTSVLCTLTPGGVHEHDYISMLVDRGVSGIVFASGMHANVDADLSGYTALRERGLPIVLINGYQPGIDAPFLSVDDAAGIDLAVEHLAGLGHRRIGLAIGPHRYVPAQRKVAAFHTAFRRHVDPAATPQDIEHLIATTVFSVDGGFDAARLLVERGATAIVSGSDVMALGALRAGRALHLALPGDLSIVGFDDVPMVEFADPPLTSVRPPLEEIAAAAAKSLLSEIAGEGAPRAEYMFRPNLVVRGSTAPPAARRPAGGARDRQRPAASRS